MTGGFLDWIGRAAMLVLAGMVTLAIIGSIAAIPSDSIGTRAGLETQPPTTGPPPAETESGRAEPQAQSTETSGAEAMPRPSGPSSAPGASEAPRWLEAITYALLALVGLAALACLLLWRGLRECRRVAEALETLAARS